MQHSRSQTIVATLLGMLVFASTSAWSQETNKTLSLGELARQLKAEREKEKQRPVAVYTNDNLPPQSSPGVSIPKGTKGAKRNKPPASTSKPSASLSETHGEKYFRSKAEKIRTRMELHRRQLAVLQQQLGLGKMQYYPNPQKTLEQESTPAFQSDVDKLRSKIEEKQKEIANDQKAMDDLQEEVRRDGGDPAWIR